MRQKTKHVLEEIVRMVEADIFLVPLKYHDDVACLYQDALSELETEKAQ